MQIKKSFSTLKKIGKAGPHKQGKVGMPRKLTVTVIKDGTVFLTGNFDVSDADFDVVQKLLTEVEMTHEQAASLLAGYMHARDVGPVSEDMGKLAHFATVYMLAEGETDIEIPFSTI